MPDAFLDSYGGQTTDQLLALEDRYRIDSLVLAFEQALYQKPPNRLSTEESYILAVEALEREVNNGGYSQFFTNSSNEFVGIVQEALRAINCPKTADITRDAIAALRLSGPASPEAVVAAVLAENPAIMDALGSCDGRYFANDEPIADRLFAWMKLHRASIRLGAV